MTHRPRKRRRNEEIRGRGGRTRKMKRKKKKRKRKKRSCRIFCKKKSCKGTFDVKNTLAGFFSYKENIEGLPPLNFSQ